MSERHERIARQCRIAPKAYSVMVFFCESPHCHRPHVVLLSEDDNVIASFVVPDPKPDHGFFFDLKGALYQSAVERGDQSRE